MKDGPFFYTKIYLEPKGGVKNSYHRKATELAGSDRDFTSRALFDAIESGDSPEWTVYAQIIPAQEAAGRKANFFDPNKTISRKDYPLIPFSKITLNKNPTTFFTEVEVVSFSPTAIVPGWYLTAGSSLQTQLFAYGSTVRYHLSVKYYQSHINRPLYQHTPTKSDGAGVVDSLGSLPDYIPAYVEGEKIITLDQYEAQEHEE